MAPESYHSSPVDLIKPSWQGLVLNAKTLALYYLTIIGIALPAAALVYTVSKRSAPAGLVLLIVCLIGVLSYLTLPYYRLILAMAKHEPVSYRGIMSPDIPLSWRLAWTQILAALAIVGGFVLLIVPGVIFIAWFSSVSFVVVDEGLSGRAALRRSRHLAAGRKAEIWGVLGLVYITVIFRLVPFVGFLLSFMLDLVLTPVLAIRYLELKHLKDSGGEAPKRGINYVFIVLGLIALGIAGVNAAQMARNNANTNPAPTSTYTY